MKVLLTIALFTISGLAVAQTLRESLKKFEGNFVVENCKNNATQRLLGDDISIIIKNGSKGYDLVIRDHSANEDLGTINVQAFGMVEDKTKEEIDNGKIVNKTEVRTTKDVIYSSQEQTKVTLGIVRKHLGTHNRMLRVEGNGIRYKYDFADKKDEFVVMDNCLLVKTH